jgi:hypothetical protein
VYPRTNGAAGTTSSVWNSEQSTVSDNPSAVDRVLTNVSGSNTANAEMVLGELVIYTVLAAQANRNAIEDNQKAAWGTP